MKTHEKITFCRMCMGHCGVVVTLDEDEHLLDIRGDHDDPQTMGYACFKGMKAVEAHNSSERILTPLKRMPDGSFKPVSREQALDEIAQKIQHISDRDGAEAIAGYKGGGGFFTSTSVNMLNELIKAMGSPKMFSSVTIDQSSKAVALGRIGIWPAGRMPFNQGDVFMIFGGNPLVSIATNGFDTRNPLKRLKQAKERGMKLIVIDPRRTETARHADVFLQPIPGEDSAILAGLIHMILDRGWQDQDFCDAYADDVEALRKGVAKFTPSYVAKRAKVAEDSLWQVAEVFAHQCKTGSATSATGPDMSPNANLSEHLIECLNIICGRFLREGDPVNPGAIAARWPRKAEVMPAPRWWDEGYKSRVGDFGLIDGELPTGILVDEILQPGKGQVKCLIVHGGNPVSSIPNQHKVVEAFSSLDLLVTIDPFMTVTAQLSDYILPPTLQYEREDLPIFIYESIVTPEPYTRYTDVISKPPKNSDVVDDYLYLWGIASKMGLSLECFGEKLSGTKAPSARDILSTVARFSPIDFDELTSAPYGVTLDQEPQFVEPGDPDSPHRFSLYPDDVGIEMELMFNQSEDAQPYRLAVRRLRDALNSAAINLPSVKQRLPFNRAYLNPADMAQEGLSEGDYIYIRTDHGEITVQVVADEYLREGVVSVPHGFGGLPDKTDYLSDGVSVNLLLSLDETRSTINAMPPMSGLPVALGKVQS